MTIFATQEKLLATALTNFIYNKLTKKVKLTDL